MFAAAISGVRVDTSETGQERYEREMSILHEVESYEAMLKSSVMEKVKILKAIDRCNEIVKGRYLKNRAAQIKVKLAVILNKFSLKSDASRYSILLNKSSFSFFEKRATFLYRFIVIGDQYIIRRNRFNALVLTIENISNAVAISKSDQDLETNLKISENVFNESWKEMKPCQQRR